MTMGAPCCSWEKNGSARAARCCSARSKSCGGAAPICGSSWPGRHRRSSCLRASPTTAWFHCIRCRGCCRKRRSSCCRRARSRPGSPPSTRCSARSLASEPTSARCPRSSATPRSAYLQGIGPRSLAPSNGCSIRRRSASLWGRPAGYGSLPRVICGPRWESDCPPCSDRRLFSIWRLSGISRHLKYMSRRGGGTMAIETTGAIEAGGGWARDDATGVGWVPGGGIAGEARIHQETQVEAFNVEYVCEREWKLIEPVFDSRFAGRAFSFVDVGGGNGNFADRLLQRYPDATGTVLDCARGLLAQNVMHSQK